MSYRSSIFKKISNWFRIPMSLSYKPILVPSGPLNSPHPLSNFESDKNVLPTPQWHTNYDQINNLSLSSNKYPK